MRIHNYFTTTTVHDTPTALHDGDIFVGPHGDYFVIKSHDDGGVRFVHLVIDQRRNRAHDDATASVGTGTGDDSGSRSRHPSNLAPEHGRWDRYVGSITHLHPLRGTDPDEGAGPQEAGS